MTLNNSPTGISRFRGCTLTGALSVTTHVRNAASVIHGPRGCSHHNLSLLHATGLENDCVPFPDLTSSSLSETDVIFGGEVALAEALESAASRDVKAIFVLSTCVIDTIGDDVEGICSRDYGVPVIPIPTAGFLGGTFQDGVNNALVTIAGTAPVPEKNDGINIIGERNLEYEVEENYREICRLLSALDLQINCRFVRGITVEEIPRLGNARLNILREPALIPVGEYLKERFKTPYITSFPLGLGDTLSFIREVAAVCEVDGARALSEEQCLQEDILEKFSDIRHSSAVFDSVPADPDAVRAAEEAAGLLDLRITCSPGNPSLPKASSVGTFGVRRMLHRWRRALHA